MKLSLKTLLLLRQAALALVAAIEEAALEAYGWRPRRKADIDALCYTESDLVRPTNG